MVEENGNDRDGRVELAIGFVGGSSGPLNVQFEDGIFAVPDYIVAELGGPEAVMANAATWANATFEDFVSGFHQERAARQVNEYQRQFIANHFNPFGF